MSSNSPYPGLRPFERDETDIFFGREEHTDQLLARLDHTRFLAMVGPSGCGKSSLVCTGLLAGLETGLLVSAGARWRVAEMRPGNQPFARLADTLLVDRALGPEYIAHVTAYFTEQTETAAFLEAGSHRAMLQAQLRRGPFSVHEILANVPLPEHTKLLILVDQFEEIFRYYQQGAEDEAAAFVSLLLASSQHANVYVVITMRSDFIGDCALFHGLPEAINQGLFLTPRLNREQLRAAIEEPARVFGGKIEPALVNRLLNDIGSNPDQLPVLQHALMRMWTIAHDPPLTSGGGDGGEGITLTMDHYGAIGGLDAALSKHADEAYNELDSSQQSIAEIMFRSLSERGSQRSDTRRPVALSDVATLAQVPWQQVAAVVDVFRQEGRSFLTPPIGKALEPDSVLDISHESLIRQWQRLQDWTTQEAEAAELYQRLEDSAHRWATGHAALWRTPELENALAWHERTRPTAAWAKRYGQHFDLAMRFLDASVAQQQAEERQAEAARQRELRLAQARKLAIGATAGFILAVGLALSAYFAQQRAEQEKKRAVVAQDLAERSEKRVLRALEEAETLRQKVTISANEAIAARKKAEESFQQARGVVDDFLTQLSDEKVKDVPGFQPVRKELVVVALQYYQGFIQQRGNDPSVQAELGRTHFRIGRIASDMDFEAEALTAYDKAAEIQQRLLEENPDNPEHLSHFGLTHYSIGEIHMFANRSAEAFKSFETSRTVQEKLIHLYPDVEKYRHELGNTFNRLGTTLMRLRNLKEAEFWFNKSLEIHLKLVDKNPEEPNYKITLFRCYNNLAILHNNEGRKTEALLSHKKGIEILEEFLQKHPNVLQYREAASLAYSNLGIVQKSLGEHEGAKLSLQKSIEIATRLVKENPGIVRYKERLAGALQAQGKLPEAVAAYQELLEAKPDHKDAWNGLGNVLRTQGKLDEAIAAYHKQLQVNPVNVDAWNNLGIALSKKERNNEAASAFAKGLELQPTGLYLLSNDAELALAQGDITRLKTRIEAASPQVTHKDELSAILPFLSWLANPAQGWENVMMAISELDPGVTFTWDFSDTARAITHLGLDAPTKRIAQCFIDFFEGRIGLQTLQARLADK